MEEQNGITTRVSSSILYFYNGFFDDGGVRRTELPSLHKAHRKPLMGFS